MLEIPFKIYDFLLKKIFSDSFEKRFLEFFLDNDENANLGTKI